MKLRVGVRISRAGSD